jgi:hypothetical protein
LLVLAAAHLAVADALRGRRADQPPPATTSIEGRLARAALAGLAGRQTEAIAMITAMQGTSPVPAVASWLRAIDVRTRLDWRVIAAPEKATLLERLQHTRALAARLDGDDALAFVESHEAEDVADWSRVLLQIGFSVAAGNTYALDAITLELREAAEVHEVVRGAPLEPTAIVAMLNQPPSRGPRAQGGETVAIVDAPLWADILQRHLADALLTYSTHLRTRQGLDDAAADYERAVAKPFGALRLFPLVNGLYAQQATFPAAMFALRSSWERPELVPPHAWMATMQRIARSRTASIPVPPTAHWFAPILPLGTVPEDVYFRTHAILGQPKAERAADLVRWRQLAPHKRVLVQDALALAYGAALPAAAAEQALAPFLDYDVGAVRALGDAAGTPEAREQAYRRICQLTADQCGVLAWYLIDLERDDEAAVVYRRWISDARDRVMAANKSGWLVDYEYSHGHAAEAWRIATDAAEVYSEAGLMTLASLSERSGAADKAEEICRRIATRYRSEAPLLALYLRAQQRGETRYAAVTAPLVAKLFPGGIQRATAASFIAGTPPDRGLTVDEPNRRLVAAGVQDGDILVAVDGYRVRDDDQWQVLSSLSREPCSAAAAISRSRAVFPAATSRATSGTGCVRARRRLRPHPSLARYGRITVPSLRRVVPHE